MEEFLRLSSKLIDTTSQICMLDRIEDYHRTKLNSILNDFMTLDFKRLLQLIEKSQIISIIDSLRNIPIVEDTLIVKSCCLIDVLLYKSTISIPVNILKPSIDWLLCFVQHHLSVGICDALRAIRALIKGQDEFISELNLLEFFESLLRQPIKVNKSLNYDNYSTIEIKLEIMLCLEVLTNIPSQKSDDEKWNETFTLILDEIYNGNDLNEFSQQNYCAFITAANNCLRQLCAKNNLLCEQYTGEILGIAKAFIHYGIPNVVTGKPQKILRSQQNLFEPNSIDNTDTVKGGKVAKTKKLRITNRKENMKNSRQSKRHSDSEKHDKNIQSGAKTNETYDFMSLTITSHSDFSESESTRERIDRNKATGLRLAAINLIGLIGQKSSKKNLYGYWHSLFPSELITPTSSALLNCVLRDPNTKCRIAAAQAISVMLIGSKVFMAQAECSSRESTSYISFSQSLGHMIITMYTALIQALSNESSLLVLCEILKCLTILIQVTPFKRLQSGFVPKFVQLIRNLVRHKDSSIQVAALRTMDFLIASNSLTNEIFECIECPNLTRHRPNPNQLNESGIKTFIESEFDEEDYETDEEATPTINDNTETNLRCDNASLKMSWLLQTILENIGVCLNESNRTTSLAVRLESLLVLTTMSNHYIWLKQWIKHTGEAIKISFNDPLEEIRLRAAKCLDILGNSMNTFLLSQNTPKPDDLTECFDFWMYLIPTIVQRIQNHTENSTLKSICCDSLSNIGVYVFEKLPRDKQIVLISLLSGSSYDEENSIRAASIRALAVFAVFPSLRDDICYVENCIDSVLRGLTDGNLEVLIKGSWALAKISDVLMANSLSSKQDIISDEILKKMFDVTLSCKTNDKYRSNIVRTLGNLIRLLTERHIKNSMWQALCMKSIAYLQQSTISTGKMKVKWNACYSIGNLMKNPFIFAELSVDNFNWQNLVFPNLSNLIKNCSNFKVRINAAIALGVPSERQYYGKYFHIIWTALLEALQQSDHMIDYNEYQHRDNLVEQLCITISHFLNTGTNEDMVLMAQSLQRYDGIKEYWTRVINRMVPEKSGQLLAASLRLKNIETEMIKSGRRDAWLSLHLCFVSPNEYVA